MDKLQTLSEFLFECVSGRRPRSPNDDKSVQIILNELKGGIEEKRYLFTDQELVEIALDLDGDVEKIAKDSVRSFRRLPDASHVQYTFFKSGGTKKAYYNKDSFTRVRAKIKDTLHGPNKEFLSKHI